MRVSVLGQFAGTGAVASELCACLRDPRFRRFRMLVAFVRWSGLHLIAEAVEEFVARGGELDAIVGVDLGGTTVEALAWLSERRGARCRIVRSGNPTIGFHPKLWMFDGPADWTAIVGSANGTTGGIHNNAELCIRCDSESGEDNPFEAYWNQFDEPRAPLTRRNVTDVDERLLAKLAPTLERYAKRPPDQGRGGVYPGNSGAVPRTSLVTVPPIPRRPPETPRTRRRAGGHGAAPPAPPPATALQSDLPKEMYMEVWGETGGGSQVQFSKEVTTDCFGAAIGSITYVTMHTPAGRVDRRFTMFKNHTFRMSLSFLRNVKRPAVVRFRRIADDTFEVAAKSKGQRGYAAWLARCTEKTRSNSKAYGFRT